MNELNEIIAYMVKHYPHKSDLSNARVTKMIYLADWRNAVHNGKQITGIKWHYDNYGPYVHDVRKAAEFHPDVFAIENTDNVFGNRKRVFRLKNDDYAPQVSPEVADVLDQVIDTTKQLSWNPFISLVYATHPITSSPRYSDLNLVELAEEYRSKGHSPVPRV